MSRTHRCGLCLRWALGDGSGIANQAVLPAGRPHREQLSGADTVGKAQQAESFHLPRITANNVEQFPPPSLNNFRTANSRAPGDCVPAEWYRQMEGVDWDRGGHSFTIATKRYRRLLQEHKAAEREREKKRSSQRQRLKDDGAAQRKRKRRAEQVAAAAEQLPLFRCSFAIAPSTDGRVQLRVQPSFKWEAKYLPKRGQEAWRPSLILHVERALERAKRVRHCTRARVARTDVILLAFSC